MRCVTWPWLLVGVALGGSPAWAVAETLLAPGPPQFVAGPKVSRALFSPSGRTVFLDMAPPGALDESAAQPAGLSLAPGVSGPTSSLSVVLWSRRTRRAAVSWTAPWKEAWVADVQWLPGTETALATVVGVHPGPAGPGAETAELAWMHLMQFDARRGTAVERAIVRHGMGSGLAVSPQQPVAIVVEGATFVRSLRLVRQGGVSDSIPLPESVGSVLIGWSGSSAIRWSPDGHTVYMPSYDPEAVMFSRRPNVPELPERWVALDTRDATLTKVARLPRGLPGPVQAASPLSLVEEEVSIPGGRRPYRAHPLWMEGGAPGRPRRFLLSTDGLRPLASPMGDAVLYVENGMALLRPILRVDASSFQESKSPP